MPEQFQNAGTKILRIWHVEERTGIAKSTIYDWMDPKSPRHDPTFPTPVKLGLSAVGWIESEIAGWVLSRVHANRPSVEEKHQADNLELSESSKPVQKSLQHIASAPERSTSQSPLTRPSRPGNLAEAIVEGGKINVRLLHYLQFKTWTPAMGALLISGIDPPPNCHEIPDGGIGLDEKPLHTSNERFHEARRIFKEWHEWKVDSGDPALEMKPLRFLEWCMREDISTEWLLLFLELIGFTDENAVDLTASRFALLTSR